jgi:hypothetical protein
MAVKDRSQLLTQNDSVFGNGKNTRGDDEKEFNDDQLDSVVMKSGDTFTAGAEFEFDNASKLREGAIDHGYGGGIAKVCANEKTDQWEDGFRYLISTSGSTNTVIYAENINGTNPGSTDDVTQSYAIGSRWKNLVSGIEYICTDDTEDAAIWQAQSGEWTPTITPSANISAHALGKANYSRNGDMVNFSIFLTGVTFDANGGLSVDAYSFIFSTPIPSGFTLIGNCIGTINVSLNYSDSIDFAIKGVYTSPSPNIIIAEFSSDVGFAGVAAVNVFIVGQYQIL